MCFDAYRSVRGCVIITEITEITERVGVFFKAFRRFLPSIKMFLLKPRNECNNHPPLPRLFLRKHKNSMLYPKIYQKTWRL